MTDDPEFTHEDHQMFYHITCPLMPNGNHREEPYVTIIRDVVPIICPSSFGYEVIGRRPVYFKSVMLVLKNSRFSDFYTEDKISCLSLEYPVGDGHTFHTMNFLSLYNGSDPLTWEDLQSGNWGPCLGCHDRILGELASVIELACRSGQFVSCMLIGYSESSD